MQEPMNSDIFKIRTKAPGPQGELPLTDEALRSWPSGHLFAMTQNTGMGWKPSELLGPQFLIMSTQGGIRAEDGQPIALGYHTGHWEVGLLAQEAAREFKSNGAIPFSATVSDPCDGRSQGTTAMFDSLPYRNDAATVLRRLARSLPTRNGVMGVATCDKGLPAMMMAIAGLKDDPGIIVPGGVTLPPIHGENAGEVQSIGMRYSHGKISLKEAAEAGCRACATSGGGCQFFGTAATSQVVAEALGLALPHSALAPSGEVVWMDNATQSAKALLELYKTGKSTRDIITDGAIRNSMVVHAACGGSTNLLLHIPAIAHAAGLKRPTVEDWSEINKQVPRLVDVLPNGPRNHFTVQMFLAGAVPEVMLHLRKMDLLDLSVLTVTNHTLEENLQEWENSERRVKFHKVLKDEDNVNASDVILSPEKARAAGITSTVCFPKGNLAPEGSVVKSTSIDPSVLDDDGVYRKTGPARIFTNEPDAIKAIKGQTDHPVKPGDIVILCSRGPMGTGMEETAQLTLALKYISWGKDITLLTDARFSGVSTGACVGHVGPEALSGGPIGKVRDGDTIQVIIDRNKLEGSIDLIGENEKRFSPLEGIDILASRSSIENLKPDSQLPEDSRLWAALQNASGGTWGGCVFDVDSIVDKLSS
ncbi:MAG: YjhG/YagF family D-xylonate dehydratase [Opitutae bacterium]|nr:YjhG/YagF family D-xylonate dehydratase [Opitutae bacterium]